MNMNTISVGFRAVIAAVLCLSFVVYPQLWVSSAAAAAVPVVDVKSESQLRAEASLYDGAIRAIAGIAAMKFATPEELKKAIVILNRERPNLRFHRSKFVVIGLNDTTFVSAVRKKLPNKQAAETFAKQLTADAKLALTVEGAESLKTRIRTSIESDAATLRRASARLKEAAEKFKRAQAHATPSRGTTDFNVLNAGFSDTSRSLSLTETPATPALELVTIIVIVGVVIGYVGAIYLGLEWLGSRFGIGTEEDKDQVADCQTATDDRYTRCVSEASGLPSGLPFFIREGAEAACYADWLARQAACLTLYI